MQELWVMVAFGGLVAATYTDIRTREVPDWLSYFLIASGLAISALYSVFQGGLTIVYSLAGLLAGFILGAIMYYSGQWGGGDSKLLMGIGALAGFEFSYSNPYFDISNFFISFWFNLLLAGVFYAIGWSVYLAIRYSRKFIKKLPEEYDRTRLLRWFVYAASMLLLIAIPILRLPAYISVLLITLGAVLFTSYFLILFTKTVEKSCMLKMVSVNKLTEGDWIAKDVLIDGKRITGPKDLGISQEQIKILKQLEKQGKVDKILIKEGMPFVPSFLAAFIITMLFQNLAFRILIA